MKLNPKKILEVKFDAVINGYSPTKVDQFLDLICADYEEFAAEIQSLKEENKSLKEKLKKKDQQIKKLEQQNAKINLVQNLENQNELESAAENLISKDK